MCQGRRADARRRRRWRSNMRPEDDIGDGGTGQGSPVLGVAERRFARAPSSTLRGRHTTEETRIFRAFRWPLPPPPHLPVSFHSTTKCIRIEACACRRLASTEARTQPRLDADRFEGQLHFLEKLSTPTVLRLRAALRPRRRRRRMGCEGSSSSRSKVDVPCPSTLRAWGWQEWTILEASREPHRRVVVE